MNEWDAIFGMMIMFCLFMLFFAVKFYFECRCPAGMHTLIINGSCICVNMSFMEHGEQIYMVDWKEVFE